MSARPALRVNSLFKSQSEEETNLIGAETARRLYAGRFSPLCIFLKGTLGAGKTTFTKGFICEWMKLKGSLITQNVTSPTYNIARTYGDIAHLDLYRIKSMAELEMAGLDMYLASFEVLIFEWPEMVPELDTFLSGTPVQIEIVVLDGTNRKINLQLGQRL